MGERPVWAEAYARYIPRSVDEHDSCRMGVELPCPSDIDGESSNRTVSWSHSATSVEKEVGQARRDCTSGKSGICRIKRLSVSEA